MASLPNVQMSGIMTAFRQVYYGSGRALLAAKGSASAPPKQLKEFLGHISTIPEWIERSKRSSCRKGAIRVLALAKANYPDLDPARLSSGFPEFNTDGSKFSDKDYARVMKETRHVATTIADGLDLKNFQPAYDSNGKRITLADPVPQVLAPNQSVPPSAPASIVGSGTPAVGPPRRPAVEDEISLEFIDWAGPAIQAEQFARGPGSVPSSSKAPSAKNPASEAAAKTIQDPAATKQPA